jgi:cysteinyl-tRNA synthetase
MEMRRAAGAPLCLFNTLGGRLQEFVPLKPGATRMYTCGPTVYAYQHIGNLRAYVFADTLRRVLQWKGHQVVQAISITDVGHLTSDMDEGDDKLELASKREHRSVWDIAAYYTGVFLRDLEELGVRPPSVWARATDHVEDMIAFARALEDKGYAYDLESGLYFDTAKVPDYGKLARLDLKGLREGARIAPVPGKRHPADFALWRASPEDAQHLMEWDSPWGGGSRLASGVLHDEHEASRRALRSAYRRCRSHFGPPHQRDRAERGVPGRTVGAVLGAQRIRQPSRSEDVQVTGRHALLSDLKRRCFHPLAYRYLLLGSRYRSQMEFTWDGLEGARVAPRRLMERIRERLPTGGDPLTYAEAADQLTGAGLSYLARLDEAVSADLNTPRVLAVLTQLSAIPSSPSATLGPWSAPQSTCLRSASWNSSPGMSTCRGPGPRSIRRKSARLLDERRDTRRRGDFAAADAIRDRLYRIGIELRDGRRRWRVQA